MTVLARQQPLDTANLPAVDTATLRAELANALRLTARHLYYLAAIWRELESRGEDLSALRRGMGAYLSAIAAGTLLAEVVVKFAGQPTYLRRVARLPVEDQQRVVDGGDIPPPPHRTFYRADSAPRLPAAPAPDPATGATPAAPPDAAAARCVELVAASPDPARTARHLLALLGPFLRPTAEPAAAEPGPRLSPDELAAELAKWESLIWKTAIRCHRTCPRADREDVFAEVRAGWVYAATKFDPTRGVQFSSYADHWGDNYGQAFARKERSGGVNVPVRQGRQHLTVISIDVPTADMRGGLAGTIPARDDATPAPPPADFWDDATRTLRPRQREVVLLRFRDGLSAEVIGQKYSVSRQHINQLVAGALAALRESRPDLAQHLADPPAG